MARNTPSIGKVLAMPMSNSWLKIISHTTGCNPGLPRVTAWLKDSTGYCWKSSIR